MTPNQGSSMLYAPSVVVVRFFRLLQPHPHHVLAFRRHLYAVVYQTVGYLMQRLEFVSYS